PRTVDTKLLWRVGWAAGAGIEIPVAGNGTAKAEYLSTGFAHKGLTFSAAAERFESDLAMQSIRLGLNYRIGDAGHISDFLAKGPSALETDSFAFHAQATFVDQYDPPFRPPISDRNSLQLKVVRNHFALTLNTAARLGLGAD